MKFMQTRLAAKFASARVLERIIRQFHFNTIIASRERRNASKRVHQANDRAL